MLDTFKAWTSPGEEVQEGVRLHEHRGRSYLVARIVMEPGAELKEHAHEEEQFFFVLEGRLRYRVGNDERVLGAGEVVITPSNTLHWGRVEGDDQLVFIEVKEAM